MSGTLAAPLAAPVAAAAVGRGAVQVARRTAGLAQSMPAQNGWSLMSLVPSARQPARHEMSFWSSDESSATASCLEGQTRRKLLSLLGWLESHSLTVGSEKLGSSP